MNTETEIEWVRLTAPALNALARQDAIVIVPVGAVEQHGQHLPVMVDARLATEVSLRGARKMADRKQAVVVTPTVWTGISEHHMDFGGTLSLDHATFHAVIRCIVRSLVRDGFRRICLLNGHGGNIAALTESVAELTPEFRIPLVTTTYWKAAYRQIEALLESQQELLHACEAESSMILALEPDLVDRDKLAEAVGPDPDRPELAAFVGAGIVRWQALSGRTRIGVIGDARSASADKGERLLEAISERFAEVLLTPELWTLPISESR